MANDRYFFKNGNPLDLRKSNLEVRSCSNSSMGAKKTKSKTTSKYKGVCFDKRVGRWVAYVTKNVEGKRKRFLYKHFDNEKEAAIERDRVARELYGEYAYINIIK